MFCDPLPLQLLSKIHFFSNFWHGVDLPPSYLDNVFKYTVFFFWTSPLIHIHPKIPLSFVHFCICWLHKNENESSQGHLLTLLIFEHYLLWKVLVQFKVDIPNKIEHIITTSHGKDFSMCKWGGLECYSRQHLKVT